jgi:hypothetical protein
LEERFLCYIKGGQPNGSKTTHTGCNDKSLPGRNEQISIPRELYFANNSESWGGGGVAFLKTKINPQQSTLGRMYLITPGQFIDVVKQEIDFEGNLILNFEEVIQQGSLVFMKTTWYGQLIYLGDQEGSSIFTFTSDLDITPSNKPSQSYLKTIIEGIKETYNLNTLEIVNYLKSKNGIENNYTIEEIRSIIEN